MRKSSQNRLNNKLYLQTEPHKYAPLDSSGLTILCFGYVVTVLYLFEVQTQKYSYLSKAKVGRLGIAYFVYKGKARES